MRLGGARPRVLAALALGGLYLARGGIGLVDGIALLRGRTAAADGRYDDAIGSLRHAVAGFDRFDALLLRADVRLGIYDRATSRVDVRDAHEDLIEAAAQDYLEAAAASPTSGQPWAGLGQAYLRAERFAFASRPVEAGEGEEGWRDVGRSGRIGVGMLRIASERNPDVYTYVDQLVFVFLELGLRDEAIATVRRAARVQPYFFSHNWDLYSFPKDLLAVFQAESRAALGAAPMLKRGAHLLSLGRVEHRLGRLDQASKDLGEAMTLPVPLIDHAEFAYYLAQVEIDRGNYREAERALDVSSRYPSLLVGSMVLRATIAEKEGRIEEAMRWMQDARRLEPRNLWFCLRFSRFARKVQDWSSAVEALRWAVLQHPNDPSPRIELVETYVAAGDFAEADRALEELERMGADAADVRRLRALVDGKAT